MNEFSLAARRPRAIAAAAVETDLTKTAAQTPAPTPASGTLGDLSRDELLLEAFYDPADPSAPGEEAVGTDRLREEVRWRRAVLLREPALTALARLLSKVSSHTFEHLTQGEINADQLIEKANGFMSGQNGVKVLKLPDRVEDLERRLRNLESNSD